ncbi:hypothetical protein NA57DRAFT_80192 [Rhizodiscina lignyota]|uniref:Uncharacterized protein n=1 Tax=Rhizodiscina lignyota TaxID=1504668 RepID=A0A9P4I5S2_9PEZI|nr:hypothetical protein NA57DRAFT_80192 [Rhizodiscina lignyota]
MANTITASAMFSKGSNPQMHETTKGPRTLLDLPGEIKNQIYRLVLLEPTSLEITRDTAPQEPPLLRTCRLIRHEARAIFFNANTFSIPMPGGSALTLKWAKNHRLLRSGMSVRLQIERYTVARRNASGLSQFEDDMLLIKEWYLGNIRHEVDKHCSTLASAVRLDSAGVMHRFWHMAKILKQGNMAWEDAEKVLQAAGDLTVTGHPRRDYKMKLSDSCCSTTRAAEDKP